MGGRREGCGWEKCGWEGDRREVAGLRVDYTCIYVRMETMGEKMKGWMKGRMEEGREEGEVKVS